MTAAPVAWMLRATRGGVSALMCGKVFLREEAARPAAERETNSWRTVEAVPVYAKPLPQPEPAESWRCFHCGELFTDRRCAAAHFGADEGRTPACQIKASEGGLVRALREAEDEVERVHTQLHAESADGLRALQNNLGRHRVALIAQEELGYERGLADQARTVAILRRALVWHGDPQRMATTREDWQQEMDEAVRFVRDHPEEGRLARPTFSEPTLADMRTSRASELTFGVQHNPNCPKSYLVRLPRGVLDFKPVGLSTDAIGYGMTFLEALAAAQDALTRPPPTEADVIGELLDQARAI